MVDGQFDGGVVLEGIALSSQSLIEESTGVITEVGSTYLIHKICEVFALHFVVSSSVHNLSDFFSVGKRSVGINICYVSLYGLHTGYVCFVGIFEVVIEYCRVIDGHDCYVERV